MQPLAKSAGRCKENNSSNLIAASDLGLIKISITGPISTSFPESKPQLDDTPVLLLPFDE